MATMSRALVGRSVEASTSRSAFLPALRFAAPLKFLAAEINQEPKAVRAVLSTQPIPQSQGQASRASTGQLTAEESAPSSGRMITVSSREALDEYIQGKKDKLVVVKYTKKELPNAEAFQPDLVDLSLNAEDVQFLRVLGDDSEEMRQVCVDAGVRVAPTFMFYRNGLKVHTEEGMRCDRIRDDILFYSSTGDFPVAELENEEQVNEMVQAHADDGQLVVVDVSLNFCGPCARVYPTVLQLSQKMAGKAVFGRMFGDGNDSCKDFVRKMGIIEAPTFLFYKNGQLCGQYVGSGKGALIGEILRFQGVACT